MTDFDARSTLQWFDRVKLMLSRTICFLALLVLCGATLQAQTSRTTSPIDSMSADKGSPDARPPSVGSPEEEMMARRAIKFAEKEREENLERAREAAQLGAELHEHFLKNKTLSHDDFKKLDRLEKVTRKIRSQAGGSDDEEELKDAPQKLDTALSRIAQVSEAVHKGVVETPRQVVSAELIERTNELLEIIRHVRTLTR
jgi:hypothetical protein